MPFSQRNINGQPPAMTDINQWRRRIAPARARTPVPSTEHDDASAELTSSPSTPIKKLRPKLSSYFSQYMSSPEHVKPGSPNAERAAFYHTDHPDTPTTLVFCQPEPEKLMECMMQKLMASPFEPLTARDNSSIMRIIEAYRVLRDENTSLMEKLRNEVKRRYAVELEAEKAERRWQQEVGDYKAEVKRLELLIAKGKPGLAGVIKARQDSVVDRSRKGARPGKSGRNDHKETVFEFLGRSRTEGEDARSAQRAYHRPRPLSPSAKMVELSHKFSMTSIHADLPFQPPTMDDERMTLSLASRYEQDVLGTTYDAVITMQHAAMQSPRMSDYSSSTYSSMDETDESAASPLTFKRMSIQESRHLQGLIAAQGASTQASVDHSLINGGEDDSEHVMTGSRLTASLVSSPKTTTSRLTEVSLQRHKPKPLQLDEERKFSFDIGDDPGIDPPDSSRFIKGRSQTSLRKSYSPSQLHGQQSFTTTPMPRTETPKSAMTSALPSPMLPSSPAPTKIPSPIFDSSLARPRRADSVSSLLTTVRYHDGGRCSNTPSWLTDSGLKSPQGLSDRSSSESSKMIGAHRLTEEKNSLRRNMAAGATSSLGMRSPTSDIQTIQRDKHSFDDGDEALDPKQLYMGDPTHGRAKENASPRGAYTKEDRPLRQRE